MEVLDDAWVAMSLENCLNGDVIRELSGWQYHYCPDRDDECTIVLRGLSR